MVRRVHLKDQSPLIIKAEDLHNGTCAVCRCGLSGAWPMCDGSHKATTGEEPGKLYEYAREMPQGTYQRSEVGDAPYVDGDGHAPRQRPERPRAESHRAAEAANAAKEPGAEPMPDAF